MSGATLLFIALFCMGILLSLLSLAMAGGERRSRALKLWGWGFLSYAVGQAFFAVRGQSPQGVYIAIGNSMICLAALLTALGIYEHTEVRISRPLLLGGLAGAILLEMASQVLELGLIADIAVPTVFATLLYSTAAVLLLRRPPGGAPAAARFLAGAIIAQLLIWNTRLAAVWLYPDNAGNPDRIELLISLFAIVQMLAIVAATLGMLWIEALLMESNLKYSAFSDQLTGVLNRRAIRLRFEEEVARCKRLGQKFGLVLFDVDHFKNINDTRGHHVGDRVLKAIARTMERNKRTEDMLGRIGGEEFLVLLPHHDLDKSLKAAERLRRSVESSDHDVETSTPATVSGGVAVFPSDGETWDKLYVVADRRMYRAKSAGRNRVEARDG